MDLKDIDPNEVIVLSASPELIITHYSGASRKGLSFKYFMLDGMGPFPVVKGKRLKVLRENREFIAFEWIDFEDDTL